MATYTENLNLKKPAQTDFYNVDDFNDNADKIDAAIAKMGSEVIQHTIPVSSWNNGIYVFSSSKITSADQIIELIQGNNMTTDQIMAAQAANIVSTSQAVGSITLKCLGDVPTIDLPVAFIFRGDL